ncbi:bifunctional helix-turn-helix transcriptional regulator/GNAT family N-acetyltransferase [Amycolatopsis cihanbeyliensis]|uniref:MarR family transcriptional regulator with acetyltransferase activity n=1 Tax=Amycolatopsis cihanbeyliensis TaxID=1128664 RepID=A0A542DKY8_AMYCI|nr:helix-turn-helix domain-containing GNAT family N-acetyltransferase [Amycolatopsis cihanbeyliensis]TQJ03749.1 MarR family transcriptional regulator with acetyltransferase activity [Amycolatopsis cihanbeyliensis]
MNERVPADRVAEVRAFNRLYTRVIGVLDEGLVGTPYTLGEARLLFEVAQHDLTEVTDLRRELDLDPGYASRLLAKLERRGLLVRERSAADGRRQTVRLTDEGRRTQADLEERSTAQVGELLAGLAEEDQRRLLAAMGTIGGLVGAHRRDSRNTSVLLRPPRAGDLGWVVHRHGVRYAAECGLDHTFEALVARVVAEYGQARDTARQAAWIAELDGEPVGSIFCMPGPEGHLAKLRLLLLEPRARGRGIGGQLVEGCLAFARTVGYTAIELWTIDELLAARRIYQEAGFELVEEKPEHRFGRDIVGQTWRRAL